MCRKECKKKRNQTIQVRRMRINLFKNKYEYKYIFKTFKRTKKWESETITVDETSSMLA